jgi:solute carrier family 50 protein (sugar transporter)
LLFFFCLFELDHLHVLLIFLQLRMSALLIAVFAFFGMVVFVSLRFLETHLRQMVVGYLSVFSLISMFASPLFIIVSP